jgi:hypothetical protein
MVIMDLCYLDKVILLKIVFLSSYLDTIHDEEEMTDYMKNLRDAIGLTDDKMFLNLYNIVRRIIDHKKNFS